jgi:hypothetical protein
MAETVTAFFGFIKPEVGASQSTWGQTLNNDLDAIDQELHALSVTTGTASYLPLTGGTLTGNLQVNGSGVDLQIVGFGGVPYGGGAGMASANIALNKALSGFSNQVLGTTGGSLRWAVVPGGPTPETGSNSGSNFLIQNFDDTGAALGTPLSISRATGVATFSQPIVQTSDIAVKANIEPIQDALALIGLLKGVFYDPASGGERRAGLVAQEVAEVLPEAVFKNDDGLLGVAYGHVVAVLVNAVKELKAKVEALQAKS